MRTKNPEITKKRRLEILKAARKCFIEKGFHQTNMRDLAATSKHSLGNIYRYFDSKEALIEAFVADADTELSEAFQLLKDARNFKKLLKEIMKEFINALTKDNEIALHAEILSEALRNEIVSEILANNNSENELVYVITGASETKKIRLIISPEATAHTILSIAENSAIKCVLDKKFSRKSAIKYTYEIIDLLIENAP